MFIEASQALAQRVIREGGKSLDERIRFLYECALSRPPTAEEVTRIRTFHQQQLERFKSGQADAKTVALKYFSKYAEGVDVNELATWTLVSRAILNLDETITKG